MSLGYKKAEIDQILNTSQMPMMMQKKTKIDVLESEGGKRIVSAHLKGRD